MMMIHKKIVQRITLSLLLLTATLSQLQATTAANYAEMGAALATMVTDMAANHYAFKNDIEKANKLKCATDVLSLSTKGLYFYNNIKATSDDGWSIYARDCQAHTIFTVREVTKLAEHLYATLVPGDTATPQAVTASLEQEVQNQTNAATHNEKQASTEAVKQTVKYVQKVILLPAFKGLTALAVACTQDGATSYADDNARFIATSTHSFAQLLEEYNNLPANSKLTKPLLYALCLNAAWIIFEGYQYGAEKERRIAVQAANAAAAAAAESKRIAARTTFRAQARVGNECYACQDGTVPTLQAFGCNHAYCIDCLNGRIAEAFTNREYGNNFDHITCPDPACQAHHPNHDRRYLSRDAISHISDDAVINARLQHYDSHANERARSLHNRPATEEELGAVRTAMAGTRGGRDAKLLRCPHCQLFLTRDEGCDHMTCRRSVGGCGGDFCYLCNQNYHPGRACQPITQTPRVVQPQAAPAQTPVTRSTQPATQAQRGNQPTVTTQAPIQPVRTSVPTTSSRTSGTLVPPQEWIAPPPGDPYWDPVVPADEFPQPDANNDFWNPVVPGDIEIDDID